MAERGRFSCAGECTVKSGSGLSGNFSGNREWFFRIINQKTFAEIPYDEYGKWEYLSAGQVSETAKDAAGKNKTPQYDPVGMETESGDCEQGNVQEIFYQPAVRL